MKTFSQYITESSDHSDVVGTYGRFRIHHSPTEGTIRHLVKNTPNEVDRSVPFVRGMTDHAGQIHMWDATKADHDDAAQSLGQGIRHRVYFLRSPKKMYGVDTYMPLQKHLDRDMLAKVPEANANFRTHIAPAMKRMGMKEVKVEYKSSQKKTK